MHEESQSAQPLGDEHARELEQLRERLSFYESFDQLIQDNIARSGELLREVASRKSEGELALRRETEQLQQGQLAERIEYRRIFSSMLDEITTVQQNVERLARQVADALDDLEAVIPAQGESAALDNDSFPTMPRFSGGVAGELDSGAGYDEESIGELVADPSDEPLAADAGPGQEPVDELVTSDEAVPEVTDFGTIPAPTSGIPTTTGFQEVVQASVDRVSAEMGASEPVEREDDGQQGITVDISSEAGEYDVHSLSGDSPEDSAEQQEPSSDDDEGFGATSEEQTLAETPDSEIDDVQADLAEDGPDGDGETVTEAADSTDRTSSADYSAEAESRTGGSDAESGEGEDTWLDESSAAATTVLVHGVPRATTALSLKRYLEGLAQVHAVEPREYAEGVLRLQVSSDRPVGLDDLRGWPEATGMTPVDVREDFLEVRLG